MKTLYYIFHSLYIYYNDFTVTQIIVVNVYLNSVYNIAYIFNITHHVFNICFQLYILL